MANRTAWVLAADDCPTFPAVHGRLTVDACPPVRLPAVRRLLVAG
ncbi:hypothetical protein [Paenibacillus sp. TH7-28]